ncbi:MAG: hypothetical protein IPJ43_17130 [Saprospiraceae bacterium]|nr:hypothetical protein [Saprospiraceae bacterium]
MKSMSINDSKPANPLANVDCDGDGFQKAMLQSAQTAQIQEMSVVIVIHHHSCVHMLF